MPQFADTLLAMVMLFAGGAVLPTKQGAQPKHKKYSSTESIHLAELPTRNYTTPDLAPRASRQPSYCQRELERGSPAMDSAMQGPTGSSRGVPGALPFISQPKPGQAAAGVGGVPVQGQLFPPMRSQTAPATIQDQENQVPKKQYKKGHKLIISNPIMVKSSTPSSFQKIATIDLATAAEYEKQRRDAVPHPLFSSPAAAGPIQQSPGVSPEEAISRMQASKRKQVPNNYAANGANSAFLEIPPLSATAATSSAQWSPGMEDLRRRSPRQPQTAFQNADLPPPTPPKDAVWSVEASSSLPHIATTAITQNTRPLMMPVRTSSLQPPPGPVRLNAAKPPTIPLRNPDRKTQVLSPNMINNAFRGSISPLVPRVQPTSMSPVDENHALTMRKSILPRSSSVKHNIRPSRQRPPSPPPADTKPAKTPVQMRAAAGIPNNPKAQISKDMAQVQAAMFVNGVEGQDHQAARMVQLLDGQNKMESETTESNRDSMVHRPRPIPRKDSMLPAQFMPENLLKSYQHKQALSLDAATPKNSTSQQASSAKPDPLPVQPSSATRPQSSACSPKIGLTDVAHRQNGPAGISVTRMDSVKQTLPHVVSEMPKSSAIHQLRKNAAPMSPMGAPNMGGKPEETSVASENPQKARFMSKFSVDSPLSTANGRVSVTNLHNDTRASKAPSPGDRPLPTDVSDQTLRSENEDDGAETVTVMLDTSTPHSLGSAMRGQLAEIASNLGHGTLPVFHCRLGEETLSFSASITHKRSRHLQVPTPLVLHKPRQIAMIAAAEPSPLESPQHALEKIRQQLKNLEVAGEDMAGEVDSQQCLTLLANLESEMGLQENQWKLMRQNISRNSLSSSNSTPMVESQRETPRVNISGPIHVSSETIIDAANLPPNKMLNRSRWSASEASPTMAGMDRDGDGRPVRRSASAPGRVCLVSVPGRTMAQLGSPTPPDTDESGSDTEELAGFDIITKRLSIASALESQATPSSDEAAGDSMSISSPIKQASQQPIESMADIPEETLVLQETLVEDIPVASTILSSQFRVKAEPPTLKSNVGSRRPSSYSDLQRNSRQPVARPLTQRPPRRSKRISLLPDILESPKPLLGKRDTLGIYQFPWGETSDMATIRPQFLPMSGTMSSSRQAMDAAMIAQAWTLESRGGYPDAVVDAYGDEYGDEMQDFIDSEDGSDAEEEEFDDGFDETTLWEIASLLRSDMVPSRSSLLPAEENSWLQPSTSVQDWIQESSQLNDYDQAAYDRIATALESESQLCSPFQAATLWVDTTRPSVSHTAARYGLPQPREEIWKVYLSLMLGVVRAATRKSKPSTVTSTSLWQLETNGVSEAHSSGLWRPKKRALPRSTDEVLANKETTASPTVGSLALWSPPSAIKNATKRLPQPAQAMWCELDSANVRIVRTKSRTTEPASIESRSLWTAPSAPREKGKHINTQTLLWSQSEGTSPVKVNSDEITFELPSDGLAMAQSETMGETFERANSALWAPQIVTAQDERSEGGLFSLERQHIGNKKPSDLPIVSVAVDTTRSKRQAQPEMSIAHLQSPKMWSAPSTGPVYTENWLSQPTMAKGPASPAVSSVYDSESEYDEDSSDEPETASPATAAPAPAATTTARTMPVYMTHAQWDTAVSDATRRASRPVVAAAWATEDEWAATMSNAVQRSEGRDSTPAASGAPAPGLDMDPATLGATLAQMGSSQVYKHHPFFDKSVLAIISDILPQPVATKTDSSAPDVETEAAITSTAGGLWSQQTHQPAAAPEHHLQSGGMLWQQRAIQKHEQKSDTTSTHGEQATGFRRSTRKVTSDVEHPGFACQTMWSSTQVKV